jgi:2-polyprenyl-3-methyl-5-hydroxy-6-metoxy-1,4-benzoquinol methylase
MFNNHYDSWRISRLNGVKKYIKPEYFKYKTLLELGCGHADIGNMFYDLGAIVTCSDARKEHLDIVKQKYPHIKTLLIDGDNDNIQDNYDIILHWGLLYHLNEIEIHLKKVSEKCNILLLESEVSDSNDKQFYIQTNEEGYDQAFNGQGIRPSPNYVEDILEKNGFQFKLIKDPI